MLSIETLARICKLLIAISEKEQLCENARMTLNNLEEFNAYRIFRYLGKGIKNHIDEKDIIDFMKINSMHCSMKEAMMIILFFDLNNKLSLSYSNFICLIIGKTNLVNRSISNLANNINALPYSIEYAMSRLLEKEIELVRTITPLIDDIKSRKDFCVYDMFNELKEANLPFITLQRYFLLSLIKLISIV